VISAAKWALLSALCLIPLTVIIFLAIRNRLFAPAGIMGSVRVMGIGAPVTIVRDSNGGPHIYAQSFGDALFGLGFVHSQDRRLQMELMRRYLSGTLAELSGEAALPSDKLMRTLGLAEMARREADQLSESEKDLHRAYADGVNAGALQSKWATGWMVRLLGVGRGVWTVRDTLLVEKLEAFSSTQLEEKLLAASLARTTKNGDLHWLVQSIGADQIKSGSSPSAAAALPSWLGSQNPSSGSNAWVVGGSRTATGFPLLSSDPHMPLSAPSGIYAAHLITPAVEVIGVGIPGLPAFFHGHNRRIAWGVTVAGIDEFDLVLEQIKGGSESKVRMLDGFHPLTMEKTEIHVKNRVAPERYYVRASIHGPLISDADPALLKALVGDDESPGGAQLALALSGPKLTAKRSSWYFALVQAGNWAQFREALRGYSGTGFNFVYADRDGHIGYQLAASVPNRHTEPPLTPLQGWQMPDLPRTAIPFDELPFSFDPPEQTIVTANTRTVGPEYPHFLSRWWGDLPWRERRICEMLAAKQRASLADMTEIQLDTMQHSMDRVVAWIESAHSDKREIRDFQSMFDGWDTSARASSVQQTLAEAFRIELMKLVLAQRIPAQLREVYFSHTLFSSAALDNIMDDPDASFFGSRSAEARGKRVETITAAILQALGTLRARFGKDQSRWNWGRVHRTYFSSALVSRPGIWSYILRPYFRVGPFGMPGSTTTVDLSYWDYNQPFVSSYGVGYRQVVDLGDLSRSIYLPPPPGQSEVPSSRHYRDVAQTWAEATYTSMLWTNEQVQADARATLILEPTSPN
jgi:penicillin amidase